MPLPAATCPRVFFLRRTRERQNNHPRWLLTATVVGRRATRLARPETGAQHDIRTSASGHGTTGVGTGSSRVVGVRDALDASPAISSPAVGCPRVPVAHVLPASIATAPMAVRAADACRAEWSRRPEVERCAKRIFSSNKGSHSRLAQNATAHRVPRQGSPAAVSPFRAIGPRAAAASFSPAIPERGIEPKCNCGCLRPQLALRVSQFGCGRRLAMRASGD